jgi:hypothetical protein
VRLSSRYVIKGLPFLIRLIVLSTWARVRK